MYDIIEINLSVFALTFRLAFTILILSNLDGSLQCDHTSE